VRACRWFSIPRGFQAELKVTIHVPVSVPSCNGAPASCNAFTKTLLHHDAALRLKVAGIGEVAHEAKPAVKAQATKGKKAAASKPREGTHKAEVIAMLQRRAARRWRMTS